MTDAAQRDLSRSESPPRTSSVGGGWLAALALGLALMLAVRGYQFGGGNHSVYLIQPLREAHPELLNNDWWVTHTLQYHVLYTKLAAWLIRAGLIEPAFAAMYLGLAVLLQVGWLRLTLDLGLTARHYLLSVILYYLSAGGAGLGMYQFLQDSSFLPGNVANVAMLWGLREWIVARRGRSAAWLAISALFHLNHALVAIGLWVFLGAIEFAISARRSRESTPSDESHGLAATRRGALGWIIGLSVILLASLPAILPAARSALAAGAMIPLSEFVNLYVRLRHPHHYDPLSWPIALWISFLWPMPLALKFRISGRRNRTNACANLLDTDRNRTNAGRNCTNAGRNCTNADPKRTNADRNRANADPNRAVAAGILPDGAGILPDGAGNPPARAPNRAVRQRIPPVGAGIRQNRALIGPENTRRSAIVFLFFMLMLLVAFLFAGVWFISEPLIQMSLFRLSIYPKLLASIGAAGFLMHPNWRRLPCWAWGAIGVAIGAAAVAGMIINPAARVFITENASALALVGGALLACVLFVIRGSFRLLGRERRQAGTSRLNVAISLLLLAIVLFAAHRGWAGLKLDLADCSNTDYLQICDWAREHTRVDAIFLVPPNEQSFRYRARRAIVVNFKCVPQLSSEINEWKTRLEDVLDMPLDQLPRRFDLAHRAIGQRYDQLAPDHLAQVARKYGARYVLVTRPLTGIEPIFENKSCHLYDFWHGREGDR